MKINWLDKWVSFMKEEKMIKLQVQVTKPTIKFYDEMNVTKELKN
jgi:hypothetical protein